MERESEQQPHEAEESTVTAYIVRRAAEGLVAWCCGVVVAAATGVA